MWAIAGLFEFDGTKRILSGTCTYIVGKVNFQYTWLPTIVHDNDVFGPCTLSAHRASAKVLGLVLHCLATKF